MGKAWDAATDTASAASCWDRLAIKPCLVTKGTDQMVRQLELQQQQGRPYGSATAFTSASATWASFASTIATYKCLKSMIPWQLSQPLYLLCVMFKRQI